MIEVLSLTSKIVFSPVWLLWRLYGMLYWAFDTPPKSKNSQGTAPTRAPERGTAFEVVDSRPQEMLLPPPGGLLKAGFATTLVLSALWGAISFGVQSSESISPSHAVIIWSWASIVTSIASIFAVRKVVARRAAKKSVLQRAAGKARSTMQNAAAAAVKASHAAANMGAQAGAAFGAAFTNHRDPAQAASPARDASPQAQHDGEGVTSAGATFHESIKSRLPRGLSKKVQSACKSLHGGVCIAGSTAKRVAQAGCAGFKHAAATYQGKPRTEPASNS